MPQEPEGTKLALILAAGELFADHGLEATSVRTIAEKAGANIAAINYHFGSKENLYTETLRYVILHDENPRPCVLLDDPRIETPRGVAQAIYTLVHQWLSAYLSPDEPRWHGRLIMRSLLDATASLKEVVEQVFEPDHEAIKAMILRGKPGMSEEEARLWAFSLTGQIAFYVLCREPILMNLKKDRYDNAFLEAAANHVARMMIVALGLPDPKE